MPRAMNAHPYADTPQYRQAYPAPKPKDVKHHNGHVGRKRTSGSAALATRGDGWTRIVHGRPLAL